MIVDVREHTENLFVVKALNDSSTDDEVARCWKLEGRNIVLDEFHVRRTVRGIGSLVTVINEPLRKINSKLVLGVFGKSKGPVAIATAQVDNIVPLTAHLFGVMDEPVLEAFDLQVH